MTNSDVAEATYTINIPAPATYTVTVTNDGHGTGTASPESGSTGTEVALTATPAGGYQFKEWQVVSGGVTITENKFKIGTANVEIKAVFEAIPAAVYTVTVVNGTGSGNYEASATVMVTANDPVEGKQFKEWTGMEGLTITSGSTITATTIFKMPEHAVTVTANYENIPVETWQITFAANGGSGEMASQTVVKGQKFRLPACGFTAPENKEFNGWDKGAVGDEIDIMADTVVTAQWKDKQAEIQEIVEQHPLDAVPEELEETYETIEELQQAMMLIMEINGLPVTKEHTKFYDVELLVSFDGGRTWTKATEENFPDGGLPVTLAYPEGINAEEYDFAVSHMFTITSQRLGTTAGEIETPVVTKTAKGLNTTLRGLSPVAVFWAKKGSEVTPSPTPTATVTPTPTPTATPTVTPTSKPTPEPTKLPQTGDHANLPLWFGLILLGLIGLCGLTVVKYRK